MRRCPAVFARLWAFVAGQVIENDNVSLVQARGKLGFDIEIEHLSVHGTVDDPGRVQSIMTECRDKRLRAPMAKGGMIHQSRPARCPPGRFDHVCLQ